jgi:hypothetical protein
MLGIVNWLLCKNFFTSCLYSSVVRISTVFSFVYFCYGKIICWYFVFISVINFYSFLLFMYIFIFLVDFLNVFFLWLHAYSIIIL